MKRASPVELRKALEFAHTLAKAGILFVPMPVYGEDERNSRVIEADQRLDEMLPDILDTEHMEGDVK